MTSSLLATRWNNCILFHTTGTFIQRRRISLPPPDDDQFYTVYHFNINIDIVFYGWAFKIYDCDVFTKNFLKKIGIKLNPPGECPEDPYMKTWRRVRSWYVHEFLSSEWESLQRVNRRYWYFWCRYERTFGVIVTGVALSSFGLEGRLGVGLSVGKSHLLPPPPLLSMESFSSRHRSL